MLKFSIETSFILLTICTLQVTPKGIDPNSADVDSVLKYILKDMHSRARHILHPKKYFTNFEVVTGPKQISGIEEKHGDEILYEIKFDIRLKEHFGSADLGWLRVNQRSYACDASVTYNPEMGHFFQRPTCCTHYVNHPDHLKTTD